MQEGGKKVARGAIPLLISLTGTNTFYINQKAEISRILKIRKKFR
jgi:hypothetical protein